MLTVQFYSVTVSGTFFLQLMNLNARDCGKPNMSDMFYCLVVYEVIKCLNVGGLPGSDPACPSPVTFKPGAARLRLPLASLAALRMGGH